MTEDEWLAATDPELMLQALWGQASGRKVVLLASACLMRTLLRFNFPDDLERAVRWAELRADGGMGGDYHVRFVDEHTDFFQWARREQSASLDHIAEAVKLLLFWKCLVPDECDTILSHTTAACQAGLAGYSEPADRAEQCVMLRDIFGNPFRPVAVDPSWLTSTVAALARGIYDERAFDRLPILADALQDAGCDHPDILDHCRSDGSHVRGCWIVDLVLGLS